MRGMAAAAAVVACLAASAACAGRAARRARVAGDGPDRAAVEVDDVPIDELVARPPELDPRVAAREPVAVGNVALPRAPAVLPLVRPRAGGDALALADLAMARNDPFDAAAQYRAILARRPAYAAYVQFRLAQTYVVLGEASRAEPFLRAAATAPAPEGWAALVVLAELRAARVGAVEAVAELRVLAGTRVRELEAYLVHVVTPADAAPLLMQMAIESPPSAACDLAVSAIALGHRDNPRELDVSCRDDVDRALAVATGGTIVDRTLTFEWQFNNAANLWERLVDRAAAGDRDAVPWLELAEQYLVARSQAVQERHKNLASYGAYAALSIAVDLLARTGQTRGVTAARLRAIASELDPRFPVDLSPALLHRLGDAHPEATP
jgi:hypothetical protein